MRRCELINNINGEASSPYFIADVGANHDGDLQKALDLINLIADAGGHAAKFQHFSAPRNQGGNVFTFFYTRALRASGAGDMR